jgi:hypothetical protein
MIFMMIKSFTHMLRFFITIIRNIFLDIEIYNNEHGDLCRETMVYSFSNL